MEKHVADIVQDGKVERVESAFSNVTREVAARAKQGARRAPMDVTSERGGDPGAIFGGVNPAEGKGPEAREAAAAS